MFLKTVATVEQVKNSFCTYARVVWISIKKSWNIDYTFVQCLW